jgi:hypothetical protein
MATSSDPFAAFSAPAPAVPESGAAATTTAKQNVPDPFAAFGNAGMSAVTAPTASPEPASAPRPSSGTADPFAAFSQLPASQQPSESEESTSWYGKSWDWLNTPLLDLHREGAGGLEAGAEDVLSGLTSPLSIALTVGTLGSGTALRALGLTAKELPVAIQGLKFLTEAGFTAQQAAGVIQESPRVLDALKQGDYETAKRLGVHVLANLGGAALGVSKAIPEAGELAERTGFIKPKEELAAVRNELGTYQLDVERAGSNARHWKKQRVRVWKTLRRFQVTMKAFLSAKCLRRNGRPCWAE